MKKSKNLDDDLLDECASVHECTGALQRLTPSNEELKKFHRQFNKK
jgi:hypothetical protein